MNILKFNFHLKIILSQNKNSTESKNNPNCSEDSINGLGKFCAKITTTKKKKIQNI